MQAMEKELAQLRTEKVSGIGWPKDDTYGGVMVTIEDVNTAEQGKSLWLYLGHAHAQRG